MYYHAPKLHYNGLTIILSKASRFDTDKLISGNSGAWFDRQLAPFGRYNCDIRTLENTSDFLLGTKLLLLLGQEALNYYAPQLKGDDYLKHRGSPITLPSGYLAIPTIPPQESFDRKNYENPTEKEDKEDDEEGKEKDSQKTSRKTFRFWLHSDIRKAIRILDKGVEQYPNVEYKLAPSPEHFTKRLKEWNNGYLIVDIETDLFQNLTCFSILFSQEPTLDYSITYEVYTIPFKRYNNSLFYSPLEYCHIFNALDICFRRNTVVGHNLSFDLFILFYKYFIPPPPRLVCTMVSHHRCHPEVEKSLAHVISYYTDLPYHKDEGVFNPLNYTQEQNLWKYNAKDVWTTFLVFCKQQIEIERLGARTSVEQGCRTVRSIMYMQYEGAICDNKKRMEIVDESEWKYKEICRLLKFCCGFELNPNSPDQVSDYLYKTLQLEKLSTKKKIIATVKDNGPTGEEALLKLYLKTHLPSIRLVLEARKIRKQGSALKKIVLWRGDRLTTSYSVCTETFRLRSRELLGFKVPAPLVNQLYQQWKDRNPTTTNEPPTTS